MNLSIDWLKDFQEFQEIPNSDIHPKWSYCAEANLVLGPTCTDGDKQFFGIQGIINTSKAIPFF